MAIVLIVASLTYRFIEVPMRRILRNKWIDKDQQTKIKTKVEKETEIEVALEAH